MGSEADTFEEHLEALRELAEKYPNHETVMDTVRNHGSIDSISEVSWAKPPKSHFHELYEEIKDDPERVDEYPEIIDIVATMVVNRPGLNNQYLKLLVLAILLEDRSLVSQIENQVPVLIDRFKTISQDFETILAQYWALDYRPVDIGGNEHSPVKNVTSPQSRTDEHKESAANLLDSMVFQAESLGYLLAACVYEYPDQIVPLTPTALELSEISVRADDELPDHPRVKNMKISSKSCIINMASIFLTEAGSVHLMDDAHPGQVGKHGTLGSAIFSEDLPAGYLDQLITHHDKYVNSSLTAVFKTSQASALAEHDPELIEAVIPDIIEMLKMPHALAALTTVAEQKPDLLLSHQNELRQLLTEGKELEGRSQTTELEYEREIMAIFESVSVSKIDNFWEFAQIWITASEQTSPQIKRAVIDLIGRYIQKGGSLDHESELIRSLMDDPDWQVRQQVAEVLSEGDSGGYRSLLEELSDDPVPEVQDAAEAALNQD